MFGIRSVFASATVGLMSMLASLAVVTNIAIAENTLPNCPSDGKAVWTNCYGTVTHPDGVRYSGEFKGGKLNGQGDYIWPDGAKYVGQFKDGQKRYTWVNSKTEK